MYRRVLVNSSEHPTFALFTASALKQGWPLPTLGPEIVRLAVSLRPQRCVSTGPVVVRLAGMANERERERASCRDGK